MFTIILAFINAKYRADYEFLFIATFLIDITMWQSISSLF